MPKPDQAAGDRRFLALLQMMAEHHEVDLCIKYDEGNRRFTEESNAIADTIPRYRKLLEDTGVNILPWGWKHFGAALAKKRYDIGMFEFWSMAETYASAFARTQPSAKIIIDSVDVAFARHQAGVALGVETPDSVQLKERELAIYRDVDAVIVITSEDEAILKAEPGMSALFLIPIIVPIRPRPSRVREKNLLFVGGFKHPPNADGIRWFLENVWERVRVEQPDATLTVVGSHPTQEVRAWHNPAVGVTVTGYVPDTDSYLDAATVSVAPLRYGGGMKGKVAEALGCGLPVVTTAAGAQGFGGTNAVHYFETDDPQMFATYVVRLLGSPAEQEKIGVAGQSLVARICGTDIVAEKLDEMLHELVPATLPARQFSWAWTRYALTFAAAKPLQSLIREGGVLHKPFLRLQSRFLKK